jgi:DNA-binding NarL/FixJ family response regulator
MGYAQTEIARELDCSELRVSKLVSSLLREIVLQARADAGEFTAGVRARLEELG